MIPSTTKCKMIILPVSIIVPCDVAKENRCNKIRNIEPLPYETLNSNTTFSAILSKKKKNKCMDLIHDSPPFLIMLPSSLLSLHFTITFSSFLGHQPIVSLSNCTISYCISVSFHTFTDHQPLSHFYRPIRPS